MGHDAPGTAAAANTSLSRHWPASVRITRTGLSLPDDMPCEEWSACDRGLQAVSVSVLGRLGDRWRPGQTAHGKAAEWARQSSGHAFQTPADAAWVAGQAEPSRRRDALSFSHHGEVTALGPAHEDELLDRAAAAGWQAPGGEVAVAGQNGWAP